MIGKIRIFSCILVLGFGLNQIAHAEKWRGELKVKEGWAPFMIEVNRFHQDSATWVLINGDERVKLSAVYCTDSVLVHIDAYDAQIRACILGDTISGKFIKNYIEHDPGIEFRAAKGTNRFEKQGNLTKNSANGKWDLFFEDANGTGTRNIGVFKTSDGIVTGSVLTNSGDMRFLEGVNTATGFSLSAFSGLSPYLFEFEFVNASEIKGYLITTRGKSSIRGKLNPDASMEDPYLLTKMLPGQKTLNFKLPDTDGKMVSVLDAKYRGKVTIVSILGSWCPNCLDEHDFLSKWHKANQARGVEIIGLAFERKDDFFYSQKALRRLIARFQITYPILFVGKVGDEATKKVLPQIDHVRSYPTTIFINKKGEVVKIHTGFNGPATGLFYEEFQKDFNHLIDQMLAE